MSDQQTFMESSSKAPSSDARKKEAPSLPFGPNAPSSATILKALYILPDSKAFAKICIVQFAASVQKAVLRSSAHSIEDLLRLAQQVWTKAKRMLPVSQDKISARELVRELRRCGTDSAKRAKAFERFFFRKLSETWNPKQLQTTGSSSATDHPTLRLIADHDNPRDY